MPETSLLAELMERHDKAIGERGNTIGAVGQTLCSAEAYAFYDAYRMLETRIAAIEKLKDGWSGAELNLLNEVLVILRGKP